MIDYRFAILDSDRDVLAEVSRDEDGAVALTVGTETRWFTDDEFGEFVNACAAFLDDTKGPEDA